MTKNITLTWTSNQKYKHDQRQKLDMDFWLKTLVENQFVAKDLN